MTSAKRQDEIDWLQTAKEWAKTIKERPVWGSDHGKSVADADATFVYFSPYRPLDFVSGITGMWFVVRSTSEFKDFLYCDRPLPVDRIAAWQLLPMSPPAVDAAWVGMPNDEPVRSEAAEDRAARGGW